MDSVADFEDILSLLARHRVRYLIVGGLAFIYHAKPRYTKDMDILVDPAQPNIDRLNRALEEFGCPWVLERGDPQQILQIGVAPHRIDVLLSIEGVRFETAWRRRVRDRYGNVQANWIDLDSLIRAKRRLDNPRHQEDVRVLRQVKRRRRERPK